MRELIVTNAQRTETTATTALEKLRQSLAPQSLKDKVLEAKREEESPAVLILDVSGSMAEHCEPGRRKIDALRGVVAGLRQQGLKFKQLVFSSQPQLSDQIPEPDGGTALHLALDFAGGLRPRKVVLVTDGEPDSAPLALEAAKRLGVEIDVFYVGPVNPRAEEFLRQLAQTAGGQYGQTNLATGAPQLRSEIAGLLTSR